MIFTSRYANPELRSGKYTAVRISLGLPRWKLGYEINGAIEELMPKGIFGIGDYDEFRRRYFDKLDAIGVIRIREKLYQFEKLGKPVVLLCFEDIRKGSWNWCHRNMFASWWEQNTGEIISELQDESKFKAEPPPKPKVSKKVSETDSQLTLSLPMKSYDAASNAVEEKMLIWVVYSLWYDKGEWRGGDMFYEVDRITRKKTRIADATAKELVEQGKAELVRDEASMARIRFILSEDPSGKAYWLARDGTEREMDFKSALRLVMEKKAKIQDIAAE